MVASLQVDESPRQQQPTGSAASLQVEDRFGVSEAFGSSSAGSCRTAVSAVFNLCNTVLGGGISIISLPKAIKQAGVVLSVVIVAVMAVLTGYTCDQLQVSSSMTGVRSFTGLARKVLGPFWAVVQSVLVMVNNFGIVIALLQTFRDVVPGSPDDPGVIPRGPGAAPWIWVLGASAIMLAPVALVHDIRKLAPFSQFALLGVVMFWVFTVSHVGSIHPVSSDVLWPNSPKDALNAVSLISLSYTCHFNALPIFDALGRSPRRFAGVLWTSMALTTLIYLPVGIVAVLAAGPGDDGSNILETFKGTEGNVLGTFLAVGLVGTVPLFSLEGIHCTHDLLHTALPSLKCANHYVIAVVFIALTAAIAILVKDVSEILSLVGCLCALPMMFILPPLIYIRTPAALARQSFIGEETPAAQTGSASPLAGQGSTQTIGGCGLGCAYAVLVFGVVITCASLYGTIAGFSSTTSTSPMPTTGV